MSALMAMAVACIIAGARHVEAEQWDPLQDCKESWFANDLDHFKQGPRRVYNQR